MFSLWSDEKIEFDGHNYYHNRAPGQKTLMLRFLFQVARRLMHRPMLIYRIPGLVIIDGIPVSDDERTKADLYFMEQQVQWWFRHLTLLVMFPTNMRTASNDVSLGYCLKFCEFFHRKQIKQNRYIL